MYETNKMALGSEVIVPKSGGYDFLEHSLKWAGA
jgi:hypothetical protein